MELLTTTMKAAKKVDSLKYLTFRDTLFCSLIHFCLFTHCCNSETLRHCSSRKVYWHYDQHWSVDGGSQTID